MRRAAILAALCVTAACGGPGARAPAPARVNLAHAYAAAFRLDATGDAQQAARGYLDVASAAAPADGDAWQAAALEASLDALVTRTMPAMGDASVDAALARRTTLPIATELQRVEADAHGPFARGLVARALTVLEQRAGDARQAAARRAESGCVQEAVVLGPTSWTPITGVDAPGPLDKADARLEATYATEDRFGTQAHPVVVRGRGCAIDLSAESARAGVRDVVVDVRVDKAEPIGVALRAHGAATLRAGGSLVLRRGFDLGDGEAVQLARVTATPGTLRLVARVGTAKEDDSVEIDVWDADGKPLPTSAPQVGSTASSRTLGVSRLDPCACHGSDEALLRAAADLATGNQRSAERSLWGIATRADAAPELALVYGRAVGTARDLSPATRAERARSAYERVLEVWPTSWEAAIEHAVLSGVRRGRDEAGIETLRDLDELRGKAQSGAQAPILDAFDAIASAREGLFDRARAAVDRARTPLAGAAILADAVRDATPLVGRDAAARACDPARAELLDTLRCFDSLRAVGDRPGAKLELTRLRGVLGAPQRFLPTELREALAAGDDATARATFAAMLPAERTLAALAVIDGSPEVRARLLAAATASRDAPSAIAPLLRVLGDDPAAAYDGLAESIAAKDRENPILPSAATAVLVHRERYELAPSGLLHWTLFDVRRVSGTTDVEENAQASAPEVWGRGAARSLRRRILKHDGRILEPDQTPHASQSYADLSQLEQGDVVEAIYEGWALPDDTWNTGVDTPDLLPPRVAVHDADIELRLPRGIRTSLWSHPLLGKPEDRTDGGVRVLSWKIADRQARRVEDGVPKMDRAADVSFSTAEWGDVARAMRETIAAMDEHDPEIAAWAHDAVGTDGEKSPRGALSAIEALVTAAGKALRESDPGTLSDYGGGITPVQQQTARTFITAHDGSRTWLVLRGLRELGIPCDLRVAEADPFSADPAFPPHFGRFVHPLLVAHVDPRGGEADPVKASRDVWIDADVAGPPLPAGRVSPELRGRFALATDGNVSQLPSAGGGDDERNEVDVRLALDPHGDARGTFAVVLRGRDAQELAEALFRIVGAERQRALRDVVLAWLPWANVDEVQLSSSEGSWQVSMRADVSVSGYAQLESGKTWLLPGLDTLHWSWPHARVSSLGATFATRAGRESALAVSTAVQYHVHRRIELPKGAIVARMPGPLELQARLVEASRRIAVAGDGNGNEIEDDFVLGVATGTIPPGGYEQFVTAAHAADDGFLAATRVTMP